jgi:hypothetical protein
VHTKNNVKDILVHINYIRNEARSILNTPGL